MHSNEVRTQVMTAVRGGMSKNEAGRKFGVSANTIRKWESRSTKRTPKAQTNAPKIEMVKDRHERTIAHLTMRLVEGGLI